jgi:curved DNA-binding protein CbpA
MNITHIALSFRDIYFNKRTGRLIFKHDSVLKYFFFQKGALIQVKTNRPEERVGEVLFKLERISKEAHDRMDTFIEPGRSIGEVLRSQGVVSEEDLSDALVYQMRETVLNTFPVFDAELSFQEHEDFSGQTEEAKISVPFLIEYGIRRMQFHPALKSFLSDRVPFQKRKSFAYLLTPDEKDILGRLNGQDASDAILLTLTVPPDFFWKSLYLFYCLDLIDFREQAKEAEQAAVGDEAATTSAGEAAPAGISDVLAFRETMGSKTLYQILEIPKTATEDEIKRAYFLMARRFHPDRFDRTTGAQYKNQIDEVFDAITNAYRVLVNPDKRKAYDSGKGMVAHEDFQDVIRTADIKFRQGKTLYGQERYDEAISLLEEAVRMRRDKADYYLLLAMAESKVPAYLKKAEEDFRKAINLEPWNPEGHVGLGLLYKNEGLQTKAAKQFEKALEADPDHAKAREAYDELTAGKKPKGLKALLSSDLFSSKKKKRR